jgi:hypothetical protein
MNAHTPGPWETSPSDWIIRGYDAHPVTAIDYAVTPRAEADANARLIAAAPDLYEALHTLVRAINFRDASLCTQHPDGLVMASTRMEQAITSARAALAKVKETT